ncbi:molybdopterin-guanine dinucleotide biosynthesis protein B [Candidatus Bathyarchaeota archaeon]|nr:molybdopterin-guanine dinucleotide biosynthesis protein B [Candidatus Bathyarchaeota archaeon]
MGIPRAVTVVGFKDAGKTQVVEAIVKELTSSGYRVATIKHTSENVSFDKVGSDTYRHAQTGSVVTVITSDDNSAIFLKKQISFREVSELFPTIDFLILEGFKKMNSIPRIIVPRNNEEVKELATDLDLAVIEISEQIITNDIPIISIKDSSRIAKLVEDKALPILGGLDCRACGYSNCKMYAKAVVFDGVSNNRCVVTANKKTVLRVNGISIPLNPFLQKLLIRLVMTFVESLKDIDSPRKISLEFEVDNID